MINSPNLVTMGTLQDEMNKLNEATSNLKKAIGDAVGSFTGLNPDQRKFIIYRWKQRLRVLFWIALIFIVFHFLIFLAIILYA